MFKSLEEIKAVAEKFEAGKIVPRRVLTIKGKGEKKARKDLKFARNVYRVLSRDNAHVFLCDFSEDSGGGDYSIKLGGAHKNLEITGSSHGKKENRFVGNFDISNEQCLVNFNQAVFGKLAVEI